MERNPIDMYLSDVFTIAANLTGHPAISVPCGFDKLGLPIGIQLTGPLFREDLIFRGAGLCQLPLPEGRGLEGDF